MALLKDEMGIGFCIAAPAQEGSEHLLFGWLLW
jgi:hypothetical protein